MSEAFFTELPRALSARTVVLSAPASNSPSDGDCAMQTAISAVERCRKPVVVEIHGTCIGGGIDLLDGEVGGLVAACDIQCCSDASYFAVKEVDLALAVDLGSLQLLPAIVGYGNATDRAMTGRRVTGSEAKAMGSFPHDPHWRMGSQPLPQVQFLSLSRVNIQPLSARTITLFAPASDSPSNGDHAMQTAISAVEWCRKPVVVEIHDTCIGGGIDFLDGEVGGLFPSRSALEDGVTALATELAAKSRLALMGTKAVMLRSRDLTVEQGLNSGMLMSHDLEEAILAQIQKPKPVFSKL